MPIPLLVWGIIGIASLLGVGVCACALFDSQKGKKAIFIGMKGAGKSTAVEALQAVEKQNKQWVATPKEGTMGDNIALNIGGYTVITDTPGAQNLKRWENKIDDSCNHIWYFFNISRLNETLDSGGGYITKYSNLVKADLRDVAQICKSKNKTIKIIVIATHTDIEGYDKQNAEDICCNILTELNDYIFIKGSLKNYASAKQIFDKVGEKLK